MRLPSPSNRCVIIGSTGSGKTGLGLWHLSKRSYENRTVIIVDYKGDEYIAKIKAKVINVSKPPPNDGGVYIVRPLIGVDDDNIIAFLWHIWRNENYLLFFDETMMIDPRNPAMNACLTQGRSKQIEMLMLSQRPVDLSRYVFSESDFFGLMTLNDFRDRKRVQEMTGVDMSQRLDAYHSLWYDRAKNDLQLVAPVPMPFESVKIINRKILGDIRAI